MDKTTILNAQQIVQEVILREIKTIIYSEQTASAPYVKFILIANAIEFLGACGDKFPFIEGGHSEDRFNVALKNYFNGKYHKYAKAGSIIYMYEDFRCAMIHQLRPSDKVNLTQRSGTHKHLDEEKGFAMLHLVLEDFYDDLEKAAKTFLKMVADGKIPDKQKTEADFLYVKQSDSGTTIHNETKIVD